MNLTNTHTDRAKLYSSYPKGPFQIQMHIWASETAEDPLSSDRSKEEKRYIIINYNNKLFSRQHIAITHQDL